MLTVLDFVDRSSKPLLLVDDPRILLLPPVDITGTGGAAGDERLVSTLLRFLPNFFPLRLLLLLLRSLLFLLPLPEAAMVDPRFRPSPPPPPPILFKPLPVTIDCRSGTMLRQYYLLFRPLPAVFTMAAK